MSVVAFYFLGDGMRSGKVPWDRANVYPNPSCALHTECFHMHFSVWLLIFLPVTLSSKAPWGRYCAKPCKIYCDQQLSLEGLRVWCWLGGCRGDVSEENQQNCFSSPPEEEDDYGWEAFPAFDASACRWWFRKKPWILSEQCLSRRIQVKGLVVYFQMLSEIFPK